MTDDVAKQIISFAMKRIGKREITESEMYLTLSMRLQWCPPHIARQFIKRCVQDDILIKENDNLVPSFPLDSISIPLGFKPSSDFFERYTPTQSALEVNDEPDIFNQILSKTVFSPDDVNSSVKKISEEKSVTMPVALLLFAKKHGIEITSFIDAAEKELFTENTE
jgi:hypothetical protein